MPATDSMNLVPVRIPGVTKPRLVFFNFTTDGSGNPTITANSNRYGHLSMTKSGSDYIVNVGPFSRLVSAVARCGSTVPSNITSSSDNGTVTLVGLSANSATYAVIQLLVET